jgi:lycopene cyclase domain-containing protein
MSILYLLVLAVSITGMVVLDHRFRLFFFADARRAAVVLAAGVATFLVWDLLGIWLGVFFRGQTQFMTGVLLAPELPLEELFFLVLLCYLTMNVWAGATQVLGQRSRRSPDRAVPGGAP